MARTYKMGEILNMARGRVQVVGLITDDGSGGSSSKGMVSVQLKVLDNDTIIDDGTRYVFHQNDIVNRWAHLLKIGGGA